MKKLLTLQQHSDLECCMKKQNTENPAKGKQFANEIK
jgi:hypothetical protein